MRENEEWIESIRQKAKAAGDTKEDVLDLLDLIERGFDDIEHRISNMDREHSKYVRATVSRMNYLLSGETDTKGLVVQLLNKISAQEEPEKLLTEAGKRMNLSLFEMISEKSLYKRRKQRTDFISQMGQDEEYEDLNREDVLKLNRIQMRYLYRMVAVELELGRVQQRLGRREARHHLVHRHHERQDVRHGTVRHGRRDVAGHRVGQRGHHVGARELLLPRALAVQNVAQALNHDAPVAQHVGQLPHLLRVGLSHNPKMPNVKGVSRIHPRKDRSSTNKEPFQPRMACLLREIASRLPISGSSSSK